MDFRFNAHDARTGAFLYTLPRPSTAQIGDVFGNRGTLELTYSTHQARAVDMPTFVEVRTQVQHDGGDWQDVGPALIRLGGSHQDTDQAGMRTVRFVGREWLLGRARVSAGDAGTELIDGKRPFYQATAGEIMRTLLLEAKDRGAAAGIELGGFAAATDSAGRAWSERVTIYYSPGLPIGDVLQNLVDQGLCDYRMNGRRLELYEPETTLGRDLTTSTNPVRVHGAVTEAPVQYTLEDLANSALLIGEDGFEVEVDNPSAPDDYGRLEVTIEQGGVNQEGTARTLIDAELQRGSREIREITRTQHAAGAARLPYRDYRCGDYVQAYDQGEWQRYRVREIQLVLGADGWTVHTVLNDRLQELLLRLAKKTNGIVNGSRGSGGDGTRPAPPPRPGVEPAAPRGLVIDQQVYLDDSGTARGVVEAGWGAVTESTRGLAIDIGGYELWWRENETYAVWRRAAVTSGDTSVSHSPVVLTGGDGEAMQYQWRVRAIAQASNRPGPWSNVVTLTMTQDTTPPPPPSDPIVSTGFRIVTVEWDGVDENGQPMPRDFSHVRVYIAAAEDMAGARWVGSLPYPGQWNSETMPADVPVWVAMTAVDRVGNESPMTAAVSVTPRSLVDDEAIRDEVGRIEDIIQDAEEELREAIDNIVVDASGTTTYQTPYEPDETTDPAPKAGDLWFDTSEEGGNRLSRYDGDQWVSAADERIDTIREAQNALERDIDRVRTSVDGKSRITQSTSTPPSQYDGAIGDRWERMSSMGSGGQLISTWRWNGDVWVSTLLSDAVIANLDAGKISTGYLDAARIRAQSISVDKLIVSANANLISDPQFASAGAGWAGGLNGPISPGSDFVNVPDGPGGVFAPVARITVPSNDFTAFYSKSWPQFPENGSDPLQGMKGTEVRPGESYRFVLRARVIQRPTTGVGGLRLRGGFSLNGGSRQWPLLTDNLLTDAPLGEWQDVTGVWAHPGGTEARNRLSVGIHAVSSAGAIFEVAFVGMYAMTTSELIVDGAITTHHIATGSITAESGIIASLNAGTITSGVLDSARIAAGSITADKLLIGSMEELAPSPASYAGEWTLQNGATFSDWADAYDGKGIRLASGSSALGPYRDTRPGQSVHAEAWVGRYGGLTGSVDLNVRIYFYDKDRTYITSLLAGTGIGAVSGKVVAPANAVYARIGLLPSTTFADGWLSVRDVHGRAQVGATLIEDGAITTDKILANAITAGKIAANAIQAGHIAANAVEADAIRAGAIDGKIITGATVRTSASGARVMMNANGLYAYDSSGSQTLSVSAQTGHINMVGNLEQRNSQGSMTVGPELFQDATPALRWSWAAHADSQSAGISLSGSGDALLMYGTGNGDGRRSSIQLARGPSTATSGMYRWFPGSKDNAYVQMASSGGVTVSSSGANAYFRAGTGSGGNAGGYVRAQPNGELTIAGNGGSQYYRIASNGQHQSGGILGNRLSDPVQTIVVGNGGYIGVYGSSRRWKERIEAVDAASFEDGLLSMNLSSWVSSRAIQRSRDLAEWREQNPMCPVPESMADCTDEPARQVGMIAEELHEAGVHDLVVYDEYGLPASIVRENFGMYLVPIVRRLRDRVDALESQLGAAA